MPKFNLKNLTLNGGWVCHSDVILQQYWKVQTEITSQSWLIIRLKGYTKNFVIFCA